MEKVVSAMERKYMKMKDGPERKAYEKRVWRAQDLYNTMPSAYEKYKSLFGEQMSRAVQKQFLDPTQKNFITGKVRPNIPWTNLRNSEANEVVKTKHFGEVGKLADPLIRYRKNDPRI